MVMLGAGKDIIGDLFRLRQELALASCEPDAAERYHDLEILAAVAVAQGMSYNLVTKASHVPRDRIEALVQHHPDQIRHLAGEHGYERHPSGIVARRGQ
jgi:hypothetical protein